MDSGSSVAEMTTGRVGLLVVSCGAPLVTYYQVFLTGRTRAYKKCSIDKEAKQHSALTTVPTTQQSCVSLSSLSSSRFLPQLTQQCAPKGPNWAQRSSKFNVPHAASGATPIFPAVDACSARGTASVMYV